MPRPRFTLRDLFWLTLVVALAVGWGANYLRWADELEEARTQKWLDEKLSKEIAEEMRRRHEAHAIDPYPEP